MYMSEIVRFFGVSARDQVLASESPRLHLGCSRKGAAVPGLVAETIRRRAKPEEQMSGELRD
jgi:hypothetical protein